MAKWHEIDELTYKNPWNRDERDSYFNPISYTRRHCRAYKSKCGIGMIIKVTDEQYDYLINGKVVTQRAGFKPELLEELISLVPNHTKEEFEQSNYEVYRAIEAYSRG